MNEFVLFVDYLKKMKKFALIIDSLKVKKLTLVGDYLKTMKKLVLVVVHL